MKFDLSAQLYPLNLFQAHGSFCCTNMFEASQKPFGSCFLAKSISEANLVVLWGSFSKKLAQTIAEPLRGSKKFVLHIQGCEKRVSNKFSFSAIDELLPTHKVVCHCSLSKEEFEFILKEVRQCLKA